MSEDSHKEPGAKDLSREILYLLRTALAKSAEADRDQAVQILIEACTDAVDATARLDRMLWFIRDGVIELREAKRRNSTEDLELLSLLGFPEVE